jgi:hypothetical protein
MQGKPSIIIRPLDGLWPLLHQVPNDLERCLMDVTAEGDIIVDNNNNNNNNRIDRSHQSITLCRISTVPVLYCHVLWDRMTRTESSLSSLIHAFPTEGYNIMYRVYANMGIGRTPSTHIDCCYICKRLSIPASNQWHIPPCGRQLVVISTSSSTRAATDILLGGANPLF